MSFFNNVTTIHTSRTLMFAELAKVMDHAIEDDGYFESLSQNISNKRTKTNQDKTTKHLTTLYTFESAYPPFVCFKHFWRVTDTVDKPVIALLFALGRDFLLSESLSVVSTTSIGDRVTVEKLEENIEAHHPGRYSDNTRKSEAQNIASSWKQAGYIVGKIKNIRVARKINYHILAFAFLMSYMNGDRGDFVLASKWVKALGLNEQDLRDLAIEAAKRGLMQYQYVGGVTTISFNDLFNKLGLHGI